MVIDVPNKLFTTFNDMVYYDEPHKYYSNGEQLISVTTLIHKYVPEFDEIYWSSIKSKQYGLSVREILRAWKFINNKGTMKGSIIHDYAENLFLNKVFPYPKKNIIDYFGFDPIWEEYLITKKHVNNFHKVSKGKLIPIRTEMVVRDPESLVAGMLDILFYNVKAKEYQIWDWKTNKSFSMREDRKLLDELCLLDDCDLEIYSLQLSMYKFIIEKNTGLKLGNSYVVWFSHNNDNYEVIEMKSRSYYASMIINKRILELKKATN